MATLAAVLLCAAFVGQDTGTIAGTITARGVRTAADIVVSLQAQGLTVTPPAEPVEMDQRGMLFLPHVLPVVVGTTVRFLNNDPVPHNVFSPEGKYPSPLASSKARSHVLLCIELPEGRQRAVGSHLADSRSVDMDDARRQRRSSASAQWHGAGGQY